MIIATAGHIDHGKTLLVKTLTGTDTDRLPEEKARGISIDLGFAYLPLENRGLIGFVDVPGHERFVRNMLAGVSGIDFAMLIVAADDGVMPQTIEHLQILDLLGVSRGVAVITKADRVAADRIEEVSTQVRALLTGKQLADMPVMAVSSVSGTGIPALKAHLLAAAHSLQSRNTGGHLRYAIDRAFTVAGSGTVVTGTVFNGSVRTGDRLMISPSGIEVRVRGIQIHGKAAESASAGERCALNLTGTNVESVRRGDWILASAIHRPTVRLDVRLQLLASESRALRHWTPVHLHLGTADVTARISMRRGESVAPGANTVAQLILDEPISALHGDRFILRDQSAIRTIGGGRVIDPLPPAGRRSKLRDAAIIALEPDDPAAALAGLTDGDRHTVDPDHFESIFNLTTEAAAPLYQSQGLTVLGKEHPVLLKTTRLATLHQAVEREVSAYHDAQPQSAGMDIETLRVHVARDLSADAFGHALRLLSEQRRIEIHSALLRKPGHDTTANSADAKMWQSVRPVLEQAGFNPLPLKELAPALRIKDAILKDFLYRQMKAGQLYRVGAERFYLKPVMAVLAAIAKATAEKQPGGQFTAAQYRDATGIGRTLAIEILDALDGLQITQRIGDARKMRKDFVPILGDAVAPPPPPKQAASAAQQKPAGGARPGSRNPHFRHKRY